MRAVSNHLLLLADDAKTVPYNPFVTVLGDGAKAALLAFDHLLQSTPVEVKEAA